MDNIKRIFAGVMLIVVAAMGVFLVAKGGLKIKGSLSDEKAVAEKLSSVFPHKNELLRARMKILKMLGINETDGYFLGDGKLVKNYERPADHSAENIRILNSFFSNNRPEGYFVLIPTKCAIEQETLPQYKEIFNQKNAIRDIYREILRAETVDAYSALLNERENYVYYRTAPGITNTGGYYIYSAICKKMSRSARKLEDFGVKFAGYGFYGEDYEALPYAEVLSDIITLYTYTAFERAYTVMHIDDDGKTVYDRLYIPEKEREKNKTDIMLGGISPLMYITADGPYEEKLLVFGDDSAKAYLPFLINHYAEIAFVDVTQYKPGIISEVTVSDYDQMLVVMGLDTFYEYDITGVMSAVKNEWPLDK